MQNISLDEFKASLAKRIKQLRKEANMTQSQLAIKIGFKDKQVVNNYEVNGANPTAYNLKLIAEALSVTTDELLDFSKLTKS